jgi:outer membrane protein assembly factor BamE
MRSIIMIIISLLLTQCTSIKQIDFQNRKVQQGNILSLNRVNKIKIGMSKNEVNNLLGSSLITPDFDDDLWEYVYTQHHGNGAMKIKHLTLTFDKNDRISQIDMPTSLSSNTKMN